MVGPGNEFIDVENKVDIGDLGMIYATVLHGVALLMKMLKLTGKRRMVDGGLGCIVTRQIT